MENMNQYYNFYCTDEGYEVRLKSNNELMAFYNIHDAEGFVCKNYIDYVNCRKVKTWLEKLKKHRDIEVVETDFK